MPRTKDDLVAIDSTGKATAFRWFQGGVERADLATSTVGNDNTTKGEVWRVEAIDGAGSVVGSAEVTIANTPPSNVVGSYASPAPIASQLVRCQIDTQATDDDGDAVTYSATWTENGAAFASTSTTNFPADTVPAMFTNVNDVFNCTIVASDGTDSTPTSLGDTPPMACRVYAATQTLNVNGTGRTGTIQMWTVPPGVCSVRIEVAGAKGGEATGTNGSGTNNNGARMIGTFAVTEGSQLKVLVGQLPLILNNGNYGGGGGTFVTTTANVPLIIAGGGGTNGCINATGCIGDAELMGRTVTSGGTAGPTARADSGAGGNIVAGALTGGGGGLLGNGAGAGGAAFVNGGVGGTGAAEGGFGGGGGRAGSFGEGGGGGYSGGSCGNTSGTWVGCGGGGSYNSGTSPSNTAGINAGNGYARFTY